MKKIITREGSAYRSVAYRAARTEHTAPAIRGSFIDEDGVRQYSLMNGNNFPADKYDAVWNSPKGIIITDKKFKGDNPDKTRIL